MDARILDGDGHEIGPLPQRDMFPPIRLERADGATLEEPIVWTPRGFVCAFCDAAQVPDDGVEIYDDAHEDECPAVPAQEARVARESEEIKRRVEALRRR